MKGGAFTRGTRKLHDDDNRVPGPGSYNVDDGEQRIKRKSPSPSFGNSQRITIFNKVSDTPGHVYYPSKHFLSK